MKSYHRAILVALVLLGVTAATAVTSLQGQDAAVALRTQEQDNYPHLKAPPGVAPEQLKEVKRRLNKLPLADYDAPEPANSEDRAKRRAKNETYNHKIGKESSRLRLVELAVIHSDWEFGLKSTLPATQSSAVVIGEVTETRAFVSEDKTNVYSEFLVQVEEVLKDDANEPIAVGNRIVTERLGGRIRFPQGISTYIVAGQGMPEAGRRYVFFLGYNPREAGSRNPLDMSRHVLTAFELREGKVYPLDFSGGGIFKKHAGKEVAEFLAEIRRAVEDAAQAPPL